jgi:hypothetical protein
MLMARPPTFASFSSAGLTLVVRAVEKPDRTNYADWSEKKTRPKMRWFEL